MKPLVSRTALVNCFRTITLGAVRRKVKFCERQITFWTNRLNHTVQMVELYKKVTLIYKDVPLQVILKGRSIIIRQVITPNTFQSRAALIEIVKIKGKEWYSCSINTYTDTEFMGPDFANLDKLKDACYEYIATGSKHKFSNLERTKGN